MAYPVCSCSYFHNCNLCVDTMVTACVITNHIKLLILFICVHPRFGLRGVEATENEDAMVAGVNLTSPAVRYICNS